MYYVESLEVGKIFSCVLRIQRAACSAQPQVLVSPVLRTLCIGDWAAASLRNWK